MGADGIYALCVASCGIFQSRCNAKLILLREGVVVRVLFKQGGNKIWSFATFKGGCWGLCAAEIRSRRGQISNCVVFREFLVRKGVMTSEAVECR